MNCPACGGWNEQMSAEHGLPPPGTIGICLMCAEIVLLTPKNKLRSMLKDEIDILAAAAPWVKQSQDKVIAEIAARRAHKN